jgi:hypothetical protein
MSLPLRMIVTFGLLGFAGFVSFCCRIGKDNSKPQKGWRRTILINSYWFVVRTINLNSGLI